MYRSFRLLWMQMYWRSYGLVFFKYSFEHIVKLKKFFLFTNIILGYFCEDEKPCYRNQSKCVYGICNAFNTCNCNDGFDVNFLY